MIGSEVGTALRCGRSRQQWEALLACRSRQCQTGVLNKGPGSQPATGNRSNTKRKEIGGRRSVQHQQGARKLVEVVVVVTGVWGSVGSVPHVWGRTGRGAGVGEGSHVRCDRQQPCSIEKGGTEG